MPSNNFQNEVGKFLSEQFPVSERIDDSFKNRYGNFSVKQKPYDFYGCRKDGVLWGAEAKRVKSPRFPVKNLYKHQKEGLLNLVKNNALGFVLINWRTGRRAGIAIWIDILSYLEVENRVLEDGRKSLRPSDFDERFFLKRKTGGWEMNKGHPLEKEVI